MAFETSVDQVADGLDNLTINTIEPSNQSDDVKQDQQIENEQDWTRWFAKETFVSTDQISAAQPGVTLNPLSSIPFPIKRDPHRQGLFDLPPEIRLLIYTSLVSSATCRSQPHPIYCVCAICTWSPKPPNILNNISTVCKLFAFECRPVFFGTHIHVLKGDYVPTTSRTALTEADFPKLQRFVRERGPEIKLVRHIRIEIQHVERASLPTGDQLEATLAYCEGLHPKMKLEILFEPRCYRVEFRFEIAEGRLAMHQVVRNRDGSCSTRWRYGWCSFCDAKPSLTTRKSELQRQPEKSDKASLRPLSLLQAHQRDPSPLLPLKSYSALRGLGWCAFLCCMTGHDEEDDAC